MAIEQAAGTYRAYMRSGANVGQCVQIALDVHRQEAHGSSHLGAEAHRAPHPKALEALALSAHYRRQAATRKLPPSAPGNRTRHEDEHDGVIDLILSLWPQRLHVGHSTP